MNDIQTHIDTRCGSEYQKKEVGYKSICMPGKVYNGLLNDLFQVYVYSPVFSHDVFKIPSFAIFIPQLRTPFYEQPQL